jgi:hypothetical protein
MRSTVAALLIVAVACIAAAPAEAGHISKNCGIVGKGSRDYRVKTRLMKCRHARKWARAFLRSHKVAPRFRCDNPPGRVTFFCFKGQKAYWAQRL